MIPKQMLNKTPQTWVNWKSKFLLAKFPHNCPFEVPQTHLGGVFKHFVFSPDPWGFMIQFDFLIFFSDGLVKNHQLVIVFQQEFAIFGLMAVCGGLLGALFNCLNKCLGCGSTEKRRGRRWGTTLCHVRNNKTSLTIIGDRFQYY